MVKLDKKIAVIGAGKMGQTIIKALLEAKMVQPSGIVATTSHAESLEIVARNFSVKTLTSNAEACAFADIILVCVKPQGINEVLLQVRKEINPSKVLITTVASVSTRFIEHALGQPVPVIRTMPNTPCLIREGMTAIAAGRFVEKEHLALARTFFETLGKVVVLDEKHLDAVTGLSGCGPAFMYMIIEALAEGGVKVGLPRDVATLLAAQTMLGSGKMVLETKQHPALLKDTVTTPAGCTIDGILELEEGGLRVTLIKAVVKATHRASRLFRGDTPSGKRLAKKKRL